MCRPWSTGSPQKTGSFALSTMSFETGTNGCVSFWSGPPRPNRNAPTQIAIQLSMIVEITSWAPTVAFRKPAMPAQQRAREHARDDREQDVQRGRAGPANAEPIQTPTIAPTRYWPWPPMLNMPHRKANATAARSGRAASQ